MGLQRLTTSPSVLPLSDIRAHLRIDGSSEDALLAAYLAAAVDYVEAETRQTLSPSTFRLSLDGFPSGPAVVLPVIPFTDVDSVQYQLPNGSTSIVTPNLYTVDTTARPGRIVLDSGSWPATSGRPGCVVIEFAGGHTAETLPPSLAAAVRLYTGLLFEQREAATDRTITEVPLALNSLLRMHTFVEAV